MPDQAPEDERRALYSLIAAMARKLVLVNRELAPPRDGDLVVEMTNQWYDSEGIGWLERMYEWAPGALQLRGAVAHDG